jgi:hypothetical protein
MDVWVRFAGHPVVNVEIDKEKSTENETVYVVTQSLGANSSAYKNSVNVLLQSPHIK